MGCNSFIQCLLGKRQDDEGEKKTVKVEGTVVLMKKDVLGFNDFIANMLDDGHELLSKGVSFQLVSATVGDPNRGRRGKVGEEASLERWITTLPSRTAGEFHFKVHFEWDPQALGVPGAVIVRNHHHSEFYLKTLTLEGEPRVHFVCNSWVYPAPNYDYDRVFFANDTYLPSKMPEPLRQYREEELHRLRGDDVDRELKPYDRVYGYDFYNDLGNPDHKPEDARPILGGSKEHPYPRRGRTGRLPTKKDPKSESKVPLTQLIYVPSDERFGHLKLADFVAYALKAVEQSLVPLLKTVFDKTPFEFDTLDDVLKLYGDGIKLPDSPALNEAKDRIPIELIRELVRSDGEHLLKMPLPQVIQDNRSGWRTDEEFGREMLAGVNPVIIRLLKEFPPTSTLDPNEYGDHTSSITADHIAQNLEGLTVDKALANKKLFILDHHDSLIPYLSRINNETPNKIYASRTLLLLKSDGTLKPLAIELSLPRPAGERPGVDNWVFTPAEGGVEGSVWHLAKAYAAVNDSGVHQLISHWLNTHAVMEPFVIATNRQLSIVHPIHKLLKPHYRDTMNINGIARQVLINADGILEKTVFPGKFAMEMSSAIYRNWKFTEQGLPDDLLKRGVAVQDPASATKIRLLIEDYPFAVDGLAIWSAVETWVEDYCSIYYPTDATVRADTELQAWWKEVREVGHGDLSNETWWPEMKTVAELTKSCTTIIWVASALHAAVNFGQYPYAGYLPNRPTISRKFMPEPGTTDYERLEQNYEKVFLETITSQFQTILGVSLIEILSRHSSDEVYLGQRDTPEWTSDQRALEAFGRFSERLKEIERKIVSMNQDEKLKNRNGPVKMPYMLLYPNTSANSTQATGLTGRGIPNSVSI